MVRSPQKLYSPETPPTRTKADLPPALNVDVREIIKAYDSKIVRAYCWGLFKILHQHFLDEIGHYLPESGCALDIGCGFGLFSLYYAKWFPNLEIFGIDKNPVWIKLAQQTAEKLSLQNVHYEVADATSLRVGMNFDGVYMLDLVHHISREAVLPLLSHIATRLNPDSRLIVKDVNTRPAYKRWFTYALDKLMDRRAEVNYWERPVLHALLQGLGLEVFYHSMPDILPYRHMLYICKKL
jgi:2-polyprenyl-3-methyl-5-hydroxy-6-metoxy-1,4-benzoquinol methylase